MDDKRFMQRALDLAKKGGRNAAPNPMVGAVIVHDGKIIGEGYHEKYGEAHAEVNAVNSVENKNLLSSSTIYVTLEPCAHYGKTPPCADLIVRSQFKRCVIACKDPFAKVAGKGIERIQNAGIDINLGVLEDKALELNKRFFTFHEKKRPYIILKWAQSKDGFIDRDRNDEPKGIFWITQPETKKLVHQWRSQEQTILVGWKTIANDNASLTVREVEGCNPLRLILDPNNSAPKTSTIFKDNVSTILYTRKEVLDLPAHVENKILHNFDLKGLLTDIYNRNLLSVFVEGGATTLQYFLTQNLWDEARVLIGDVNLGKGQKAPVIDLSSAEKEHFGKDQIYSVKNIK